MEDDDGGEREKSRSYDGWFLSGENDSESERREREGQEEGREKKETRRTSFQLPKEDRE